MIIIIIVLEIEYCQIFLKGTLKMKYICFVMLILCCNHCKYWIGS